jgi:hypothetical protein
VALSWQGRADSMRLLNSHHDLQTLPLKEQDHEIQLHLEAGTYYLNLYAGKSVSRTLTLQVWPAEKIVYFSPLNRDRSDINHTTLFSWSPLPSARSFEVQFFAESQEGQALSSQPVKGSYARLTAPQQGLLYWQVQGRDSEGFVIPAYYRNLFFAVDGPLAAPRLKEPEWQTPLRQPSQEAPKKNSRKAKPKNAFFPTSLKKVWDQILPMAWAEDSAMTSQLTTTNGVRFSWYPVPEADHYVVEISDSAQFESPIVTETVNDEHFDWSGFVPKVYFWRVAAGQRNGKMGLFSESARVDLSHATAAQGLDLAPSGRPSPASEPTSKSTFKKKPAEMVSVMPAKAQELSSEDLAFHWSWTVGLEQLYTDWKLKDGTKASLRGPAATVETHLNVPRRAKGSYIFEGSFSDVQWKRESEQHTPFQGKMSEIRWKLSALRRSSGSNLSYGLRAQQFGYPQRSGPENLVLKQATALGVLARYSWQPDLSWQFDHQLGAESGGGFTVLSLSNQVSFKLTTWEKLDLGVGAGFDFRHFSKSSAGTGSEFAPSLNFNMSW